MAKGDTALQTAINEALAQMEEDGFIDETYDYWFGSGADTEE
jgi:polar amino acid transport system substrate-binding protein